LGILAVALSVWLAYGVSHRFMDAIGPARARALAQLSALVLLCWGVQLIQRGLHAGLG
jgi:small neutral amino acid transporter SnatA (MarC family)